MTEHMQQDAHCSRHLLSAALLLRKV
jgi:hypothetical protein